MTILERSACVMRAPGGAGVASLPRWAHTPHHERALSQASLPDDAINNRLVIWHGDISLLDADVITNWTDSSLTECNAVSERILDKAGPELKEHVVSRGYDCSPDEVVVTGGYSLRCRHIIHVVYPKLTGSEASLMNCYNRALNAGMALGARSLALCAVPGQSPELAADIALRAARLYLERNRSSLIILVGLRASDAALLAALAPAHFPHGSGGAATQAGAGRGDHRIRIIHNPHEHDHDTADDDTSLYEEESAAAIARALAPDTQRLLAPTPRRATLDNLQHDQYERLLRRAHTEDLSSVSGIGCLYQSGVDRLGRPVVIFIGKWFPITDIDLDKALLYLIKLLDPIVRGDYVIAYFHTLASSNNHPPFSWLKEVYTVLPYKYKKNLKAFYIVHPTFWTKMMTWWFTTFMAPAIKAKVHNLPGVEYLYSVMPHDQLEVPAFVTEYDMTINGIHYFQPDSNNT